MSGYVGRCYQRQVLGNPKMGQVASLCQDEDVLGDRVLYLCEFSAEVLDKYLLEAAAQFHRLFAD